MALFSHPLPFSILVYIGVFAYLHHIFMAGLLISTLFMLFYELRIFIKEKIWRQKDNSARNPWMLETKEFFLWKQGI